MFSVHCPRHGADVLLSERRIEALVHRDDGIDVRWVCWCGARGSFTTARPRRSPAMSSPAMKGSTRVPAITR